MARLLHIAIIPILILLLVSCDSKEASFRIDHYPTIYATSDLKANIGKRVRLTGIYHNCKKGPRYIAAKFCSLDIQDYSLLLKTADGLHHDIIGDGTTVNIEATLCFFPGSISSASDIVSGDYDNDIQDIGHPSIMSQNIRYIIQEPVYQLSDVILLPQQQ